MVKKSSGQRLGGSPTSSGQTKSVVKPKEEGQPQMVRQGQGLGKHTNCKQWTQFLFFLLDGSFLSFQNLEDTFNMFVFMWLHLCVYVLMCGMWMWMYLHVYALVPFSLWYTPNFVHPVYEIGSPICSGILWLHQACWPASRRALPDSEPVTDVHHTPGRMLDYECNHSSIWVMS